MLTGKDLRIEFERKSWSAPEKITDEGTYIPTRGGINYVITVTNKSTKTIDWIKADAGLILDGSTTENKSGGDGPSYTHHYRFTGIEQFTISLPWKIFPNGSSWHSVSAADFGRSKVAPSDRWVLLRVYGKCEGQPFIVHEHRGILPLPDKVLERTETHYCFIAHAAFKDTDHPTVAELRRTRDEVLKQYRSGRRFIRFYYKHSPRIAASMASKPRVCAVTRGVLTPLAQGIRCTRAASAVVRPLIKQLFNSTIK